MGGAAHRECEKGSSLRVRGGGWLRMTSPGVEISIAGGVMKMVRDPNSKSPAVPFPSSLCHIKCFVLFVVLVQGPKLALAMAKQNLREPTGARKKAINISPSSRGPTACQPHKTKQFNPDYLTGAERENQMKTWGGINRKALTRDPKH